MLLFYPYTIRLRCVQFFQLSLVVYARRKSGNTVPAFCIILYFLLSSHVYYNVCIILLLCGRIKANTDAAHLHFLSSSSTALMYITIASILSSYIESKYQTFPTDRAVEIFFIFLNGNIFRESLSLRLQLPSPVRL